MVHHHGESTTVYPGRATVNGGSTMRLISCRGFSMVELLVALVAGLVWFFTQTELGQQIWQGFVDALAAAWTWLWRPSD